ncbi:hypothetical protein STAFG_8468 [Streptomyces afghaniensis 772]|uniref:Uncharacterized protein n=1 Tax=Streptomyces afghaniensis 772 TaxID=1283301 RepID=S4MLZ5_9ACTN|nr:hypothetical protein STAFG_8468 [Streptomyces afghaniensis 772]
MRPFTSFGRVCVILRGSRDPCHGDNPDRLCSAGRCQCRVSCLSGPPTPL